MKKLTLSFLLLIPASVLFAQVPPSDPKHENHYSVSPIENDDIKIEFKNAHSQQEFTQVEVDVTNKTSDYIYCKGTEAKFIYAHGTYQSKSSMLSNINFTI